MCNYIIVCLMLQCAFLFGVFKVFSDPHVEAMQAVQSVEHPVAGNIKLVSPPVLYSYSNNKTRLPPPLLGQHTNEILQNILGYSSEKIEELKKIGAVA